MCQLLSAVLNGLVIPSEYYTSLLFGLMVKFGRMVFYLFGPSVCIYLVVRFRLSDPVSFVHGLNKNPRNG